MVCFSVSLNRLTRTFPEKNCREMRTKQNSLKKLWVSEVAEHFFLMVDSQNSMNIQARKFAFRAE
jgi:hypothetical protein